MNATNPRSSLVARNFIVVIAGQLLMWAATSALVIIAPRYLGDSNLGKFSFAFSFSALFGTFVLFGSSTYLTREIARNRDLAGHLAFNAVISRIPLIALASLAIVAFVHLLDYPQSTINVVYITVAMMALITIGNTLSAAIQGLERMVPISAAAVAEKILGVICGVTVLVFLGYGLYGYALALLGALAVNVLIQTIYFWTRIGFSWRIDLPLWKTITRGGAPFLIWNVSLVIYGSIDITMLSLMTEDKVVGWYGMAYRFISVPAFVPFAVTTALLPTLSSVHGAEFRNLAGRCLDLVILVSLPIALFFLVAAQQIIDFFHYPEGFQHSVVLMRILAIHEPLVAISMVAGTVLIASNREGPWARVGIVAAVLNPAVNLFLIPYFNSTHGNGAIGASIGTVATEGLMVSAALVLIGRGTFGWNNVTAAARCLAACVPMAVVMLLVLPYGLITIIAAGSLSYGAAALLFGAVSLHDIFELPRMVMARPRLKEVSA